MKNLIVISLFIVMLPSQMEAQRDINRFIDRYYDKENVTTVELSGLLLKMAARFVDEEGGKELLASISRLQVMAMDGQNHVSAKDLKALKSGVQKKDFEQLMMIRDGKTTVDFYMKEKKGAITNLLILVSSKDEFVLLNIKGKLKFRDLRKLDFNVNGSEHLKKLPKTKTDVPRAN